MFFILLGGSSLNPFFVKFGLEDLRASGFIRQTQFSESDQFDLSYSLQVLSSSIFKQFVVSNSKDFSLDGSINFSPEYLYYQNSNLISKYIRDIFISSQNSNIIFNFLFDQGFLNLVIYLKIDSIWRKNSDDFNKSSGKSNFLFLEDIKQSLQSNLSANNIYLKIGRHSLNNFSNNISFVRKLALNRMGLISNFKFQSEFGILEDLNILNSREQLSLSSPFYEAVFGCKSLSILGLDDVTIIFYEKFFRVFGLVLNSKNFAFCLKNLNLSTNYGLFLNCVYLLKPSSINLLWTSIFLDSLWGDLKLFIGKEINLLNEIVSLIRNPFNCGIWSYLLENRNNFPSYYFEFYSILFSISFASIWKFHIFEYFLSDSLLHLSFFNTVNRFTKYNFYRFKYSIKTCCVQPYKILCYDPFWVMFFRNLPYKIRSNFLMFLRNLFRNPFFDLKRVFLSKFRFGFNFWKFYIERRLVKILLSREFKLSIIGFLGTKVKSKGTLFQRLSGSANFAWKCFFESTGKLGQFPSVTKLHEYNLRLLILNVMLGNSESLIYNTLVLNPSLYKLYCDIFYSNSSWLNVLSKPASFKVWENFFESVPIEKFNLFFNKFLINTDRSTDSINNIVSRLNFSRLVFKNVFKSMRSGFSVYQGLNASVINTENNEVFDVSGFGFSCNYLFFLFRTDLTCLFSEISNKLDFDFSGCYLFKNFSGFTSKSVLPFLSYMYSIFKPLFVHGEFYKSGSRSNRNYSVAEDRTPSFQMNIDVERSWIYPDLWDLDLIWLNGRDSNWNEEIESSSFPIYSSTVNSSDMLSRNLLSILPRIYVKLYYKFFNTSSTSSCLVDIRFLNYLSEKCSLIESFKFNEFNMIIKNFKFDNLSRFEILNFLSSYGELFFYYGIDIFFNMYRQTALYFNILCEKLKLVNFYGISGNISELKSDLGSRGLRQLYNFVWLNRDESNRFSFNRESRMFTSAFFSYNRIPKRSLYNFDFFSFPGLVNGFTGLDTYSKINSLFGQNLILDNVTTAGIYSFFPYNQTLHRIERSSFFQVSSVLGFFLPNRYYIMNVINYLYFFILSFWNLINFSWTWIEILRSNKYLFTFICTGIVLLCLCIVLNLDLLMVFGKDLLLKFIKI